MQTPGMLPCDGCGQPASPEHLAQRFARLEWATRFRPIHIQAVLLAFAHPVADAEFLYAPEGAVGGHAARVLEALAISTTGKSREDVLVEFQKRGLVLSYLLECPLEGNLTPEQIAALTAKQLSSTLARIRRSLKPKRVLLVSPPLRPFAEQLTEAVLGCPVFPTWLTAFDEGASASQPELQAFRAALPALIAHTG